LIRKKRRHSESIRNFPAAVPIRGSGLLIVTQITTQWRCQSATDSFNLSSGRWPSTAHRPDTRRASSTCNDRRGDKGTEARRYSSSILSAQSAGSGFPGQPCEEWLLRRSGSSSTGPFSTGRTAPGALGLSRPVSERQGHLKQARPVKARHRLPGAPSMGAVENDALRRRIRA